MFSKRFTAGFEIKLISGFLIGLMLSTSVLYAGDAQKIISEVKKEIRLDGLSVAYSASEDFDQYAYFDELFKKFNSKGLVQARKAMKSMAEFNKGFGWNDLDGFGSSVAKEGEFYDWDFFMHLKEGNEKSILWQMMGEKSQPLKTVEVLPDNTLISITWEMNLAVLFSYVKKMAPILDFPDAELKPEAQLKQFEEMMSQRGLPLDKLLASISTESSIFLTKNAGEMMNLPDMPPLPQMGLSIIMQKKDDFVQNYILQLLSNAPTQKVKVGGFDVVILNDSLPSGTKAGFAYNDSYMIFSSDIKVVEKVADAISGKGLVHSKKFTQYSKLPRKGNMAFYVSEEVSDEISKVMKTMPEEAQFGVSAYSGMFFQDKTPGFFVVGEKKKNGIKIDALSTFNLPGSSSTGLVAVGFVGILAAMILPALGKARMKAKQARSKSNLKNMGTEVATYFATGEFNNFPKDYKKFEFPEVLFIHPGTGREVTLEDVFRGKGDYLPVYKPGTPYSGSADKILFIEKPGLWKDGIVFVVFEDGHVDGVYADTVEEVIEYFK